MQRIISPKANWSTLHLSPVQKKSLQDFAQEGDGTCVALFVGNSGTGKTLAAEAIAGQLKRRLMRVDASRLVGKYIGETEKNLAKIFQTAQANNAVLFFDEADALFGKRSDVKDSHDRFANQESSYLLQQVTKYKVVAMLSLSSSAAGATAAFAQKARVLRFFGSSSDEDD